MKVLFAVNNEEISESIVKKYQKEYKQIISYKNVYYFNAILKELQKDKTYDRIVISEDLEAFTHTQYDQIDKFIFEKLDSISDEASDLKGNDTPIILICSDRRTESEAMLVKLFGIGIYNAIIGTDRSVDEVCKLINRPRGKKEAKSYYNIDTEDVNYQAENENDVSEMEIQNIVAHYKRLGKNEDRYIDSFNNIAAQYNDTQLRIITKFLPLNVRAVLEEKSPKYQQIMSFNNTVSDSLRKQNDDDDGPSQILLKMQNKDKVLSKPVVIPSAVNMDTSKKLTKPRLNPEPVQEEKNEQYQKVNDESFNNFVDEEQEVKPNEIMEPPTMSNVDGFNNIENDEEIPFEKQDIVETAKRGRGRPRKNPVVSYENQQKRGRGRPKKEENQIKEESENEFILPGLNTQEEENQDLNSDDEFLPGFEPVSTQEKSNPSKEDDEFLPGFNQNIPEIENQQKEYKSEIQRPVVPNDYNNNLYNQNNVYNSNQVNMQNDVQKNNRNDNDEDIEEIDFSNLLTPDKKIATFIGTSKNGTSFIVNNLAELMSSVGINTAILDTTQNRNSYYIYTKNEETLREVATHSIEGLTQGVARGISVNKNLTVYTSLPNEEDGINHVDKILETLLMNHSLILIDTDFDTPINYFKQSQEIYLVQTMDILTIQPLTAFLKQLKMKNILDEKKLRVVLNKVVRIKGIKDETIIGGMAFYNDPAMSFMTELFDRDRIKYVAIPFEEETYIKYLEGVIECEISLKGYSKMFLQTLKQLGSMIYPIITATSQRNNGNYQPPSVNMNGRETFPSNMNSTLDKMKRNF